MSHVRAVCLWNSVRTFAALVDVIRGLKSRPALTGLLLFRGTDGSIKTALDGLITFVTQLLITTLYGVCGDKKHCIGKGSEICIIYV
jgi:hypothetical protein